MFWGEHWGRQRNMSVPLAAPYCFQGKHLKMGGSFPAETAGQLGDVL